MSAIERLLARDGCIAYKTRGVSMRPMLRANRDLVVVRSPSSRLRKYDVALYKRGDAYVLHRVIGIEAGHYLIRGDNTYVMERIPDSAVIGVLVSFKRGRREISVDSRGYVFYTRFWNLSYPVRAFCVRGWRKAMAIARRTGLLPAIRKMMGSART